MKINSSTRQAEWTLHGLTLLGGTSRPGFLQLKCSNFSQHADVDFLRHINEPSLIRWLPLFASKPTLQLAQRDQLDGLGHQADHQDGKAGLCLQQGVPGGPGVPAQRWLHRAHDPSIRCQLWLRAKCLAGRLLYCCIPYPTRRYPVFPSMALCLQIPGSSDKRVLSMDVLKVVMGQLNQLYLIQRLFVSSRRRADLGWTCTRSTRGFPHYNTKEKPSKSAKAQFTPLPGPPSHTETPILTPSHPCLIGSFAGLSPPSTRWQALFKVPPGLFHQVWRHLVEKTTRWNLEHQVCCTRCGGRTRTSCCSSPPSLSSPRTGRRSKAKLS